MSKPLKIALFGGVALFLGAALWGLYGVVETAKRRIELEVQTEAAGRKFGLPANGPIRSAPAPPPSTEAAPSGPPADWPPTRKGLEDWARAIPACDAGVSSLGCDIPIQGGRLAACVDSGPNRTGYVHLMRGADGSLRAGRNDPTLIVDTLMAMCLTPGTGVGLLGAPGEDLPVVGGAPPGLLQNWARK